MSTESTGRPMTIVPAQKRECTVCRGPISPRDVLHEVCGSAPCRLKYFRDLSERQHGHEERARRAQIVANRASAERETRRIVSEWAARESQSDPSDSPLAIIPYSESPITNFSERRRRAFREHLMRVLSEATRQPSASLEPEANPTDEAPEIQPVLGQICAFCRGWCCRHGGIHAYLSVDTLRRYMAANPGRRPWQVLEDYLSRLANRVVKGSCVYHGPRGCGLPREMRSNICNDFYCGGIHRFRRAVGDLPPARAVFAAETDGHVHAVALMREGRTRLLPLPVV
jgi:hypothetical protein